MAVGLSAAIVPKSFRLLPPSLLLSKPTPVFSPLSSHGFFNGRNRRKTSAVAVCFVLEEKKQITQIENLAEEIVVPEDNTDARISADARVAEKLARKRSERFTYLVAAVMSTFGITSMAVMAVYYRFAWQMEVVCLFSLKFSS